jgi:two-component system sensor histidine kinase NreB
VETVVYRVLQESLSNATKHSSAETIQIKLTIDGEILRLRVSDDGTGFEPEAADRSRGLGLQGMNERARLVGGHLFIDAAPGTGSAVILNIPIKPRIDDQVRS